MPFPAPASASLKPLSDRERRFVDAYLTSFNGRDALRRSGYAGRDGHGSWRIRNRPAVRAALEAGWRAKVEGGEALLTFPAARGDHVPSFGNVRADPALRPLTAREARYVEAFLEEGRGRAAARKAGYGPALTRNSHLIRRRPAVAAAIAARVKASLEAMGVSPERLIEALTRQVFFDPVAPLKAMGIAEGMERLPPELRTALSVEVTYTKAGQRVRWKTPDRQRAMVCLWRFIESDRSWHERMVWRLRCPVCERRAAEG